MNIMMVTSSVCSSSNMGVHGSTRSGHAGLKSRLANECSIFTVTEAENTVKGSFDQLEDISVSEWTAWYTMMLRRSWKVCTNRF